MVSKKEFLEIKHMVPYPALCAVSMDIQLASIWKMGVLTKDNLSLWFPRRGTFDFPKLIFCMEN